MSFLEGGVHVWGVGLGLNVVRMWVEEEGCPNFEPCSKFIQSAYADRAALKTRHWRVFFTLRAPAGSNPSSSAVFACKGIKTKKPPISGAFSTKMAEEEGFEPS